MQVCWWDWWDEKVWAKILKHQVERKLILVLDYRVNRDSVWRGHTDQRWVHGTVYDVWHLQKSSRQSPELYQIWIFESIWNEIGVGYMLVNGVWCSSFYFIFSHTQFKKSILKRVSFFFTRGRPRYILKEVGSEGWHGLYVLELKESMLGPHSGHFWLWLIYILIIVMFFLEM